MVDETESWIIYTLVEIERKKSNILTKFPSNELELIISSNYNSNSFSSI